MDIMSVVLVLAALVALASPLWVGFVTKPESKDYSDRLETTINLIDNAPDHVLEELAIYITCRRLLLHVDRVEGLTRLDQGHS